MTADTTMTTADELLLARGADRVAHPGGTLLEHLRRVCHLLDDWGASPEIQLAGLCHACYGTDGFPTALLNTTERPRLVEVIGAEAEAHVYLYGSCERAHVYPQLGGPLVEIRDRFTGGVNTPERAALHAFMEITAANELDVIRHSSAIAAEHGPALHELITRARDLLSPRARQAWSDTQASQASGPPRG